MATTEIEPSCCRCGRTSGLEEDHIIPKCKGGSNDHSNKRWLCTACHDFRHARDQVLREIEKCLKAALTKAPYYSPENTSLWIFRLGVLEAFNTPEKIRERGKYMSYFEVNATHISAWLPVIKAHALRNNRKVNPPTKSECLLAFAVK